MTKQTLEKACELAYIIKVTTEKLELIKCDISDLENNVVNKNNLCIEFTDTPYHISESLLLETLQKIKIELENKLNKIQKEFDEL